MCVVHERARRVARACAARAWSTVCSARCGSACSSSPLHPLRGAGAFFGWRTLLRHRAPVLQARASNLPPKWQAKTFLQTGTRFSHSRWRAMTVLQTVEAQRWLPMPLLRSTRSARRRFGFAKPSLPAIEGLILDRSFAEPSFAAILGAFPRLSFANPAFAARDTVDRQLPRSQLSSKPTALARTSARTSRVLTARAPSLPFEQ